MLRNQRPRCVGSILVQSPRIGSHPPGDFFFAPLFVLEVAGDIYGPAGLGQSLRDTLAGQMEHIFTSAGSTR